MFRTAQVSLAIIDDGETGPTRCSSLIVQQNRRDPVSTFLATDNFTIVNAGGSPPPRPRVRTPPQPAAAVQPI